jgi:PEP-CTERM motif
LQVQQDRCFKILVLVLLNQNNGTINYSDGWSFVNAPNVAAQMTNPDPACQMNCQDLMSFYEFTLINSGSITVNWSSSSFGSNIFGIEGIDVTFDPPPHAMFTNLFQTSNSGNGSFTNDLTAGTHTIAFWDPSNVGFGGTTTLDAHVLETLMFSVSGTVEPPSAVPEPSALSLLGVGLLFSLAVVMRRMRLRGRFHGCDLRWWLRFRASRSTFTCTYSLHEQFIWIRRVPLAQ